MYRKLLLTTLLALGLSGPASATIIALAVSSGGIDDARVCTATNTCGSPAWQSNTLYGVTGSITIDTSLNTLSLSLFADTSVISGAAINGVTALTFDDATYGSTVLPVTASAGPLGSTLYTISAGQTASVSVSTLSETGGSSGAYARTNVRVTGSCLINLDGTGQCGLTFGPSGTTTYYVGAGDGFALERYVRQTMNLGVVPEPGSLLLGLVGLAGLALASRPRAR